MGRTRSRPRPGGASSPPPSLLPHPCSLPLSPAGLAGQPAAKPRPLHPLPCARPAGWAGWGAVSGRRPARGQRATPAECPARPAADSAQSPPSARQGLDRLPHPVPRPASHTHPARPLPPCPLASNTATTPSANDPGSRATAMLRLRVLMFTPLGGGGRAGGWCQGGARAGARRYPRHPNPKPSRKRRFLLFGAAGRGGGRGGEGGVGGGGAGALPAARCRRRHGTPGASPHAHALPAGLPAAACGWSSGAGVCWEW